MADLDEYRDQFIEAMDDDFNTAGALAALFDMSRDINRFLNSDAPVSRGTLASIDRIFRDLGGDVLGLIPDDLGAQEGTADLASNLMALLVDLRNEYRTNKEYDKADAIRDRLVMLGVVLEDYPGGTNWYLSSEDAEGAPPDL
jgi:cysteinyl-tRNA synthetase